MKFYFLVTITVKLSSPYNYCGGAGGTAGGIPGLAGIGVALSGAALKGHQT